jgi:hypothetical protein
VCVCDVEVDEVEEVKDSVTENIEGKELLR